MPRTGHFKCDELKKENPPAYDFLCSKTKDNEPINKIVRGLKENFNVRLSSNSIWNWRSRKYLKELQAQEIAVELKSLLGQALQGQDIKDAVPELIQARIENLVLQYLESGKLAPDIALKYTAVFRRLENEKLKIGTEKEKVETEHARLELAKQTAEKQTEYYKLKIAEIQKTAKEEGQISEDKLNGILHGYFGIDKDGHDKKKD